MMHTRSRAAAIAFAAAALGATALTATTAIAQTPAQAQTRSLPTFAVDPSWPKVPPQWKLGDVSSMASDAQGNIWVLHRPRTLKGDDFAKAAPPVIVFDQAGNYVKSWGGDGQGYDWPQREHGIYIDNKGFVWLGGNSCPENGLERLKPVADDALLKFTQDGKFVMQIGHSNQSKGNADTTNVHRAADVQVYPPTNELFVADGYGNHRVIVFDAATGAYKRHWGAYGKPPTDEKFTWDPKGPPPQQFGNPVHCITITNDGLVLVCDRSHNRMQMFRKDGTFVREISVLKESAPGTIGSIVKWPDAAQTYLLVVDDPNGEFHVINRADGKLMGSYGRVGHQLGEFYNLHFIGIDSKGNVYSAEVQGKRVQKFRNLGGL
jgi:hypothetical protein